jgi:hypothetical protein
MGLDEFMRDRLAEREGTPVQPEGDVVERMLQAYDGAKDQDFNASPSERRSCMTAAYQVARAQVIAEALAEVTDDEWGKARPETRMFYNRFLSERRNRLLAQADKPRTPAERVTIKLVSYPTIGDRWQVLLDGKIDDAFGEEITAKRYAAGLRAELEKA